MPGPEEFPVPGVRGLEHTADVGLEISAPTLPELFRRAALGAIWLVLERHPVPEREETPPVRTLHLTEEDPSALLRAWLRAILLWAEVEGFVAREAVIALIPTPFCEAPDGLAIRLEARVEGLCDQGPRVREIKGVTFHELRVERRDAGWYGRVIFDV